MGAGGIRVWGSSRGGVPPRPSSHRKILLQAEPRTFAGRRCGGVRPRSLSARTTQQQLRADSEENRIFSRIPAVGELYCRESRRHWEFHLYPTSCGRAEIFPFLPRQRASVCGSRVSAEEGGFSGSPEPEPRRSVFLLLVFLLLFSWTEHTSKEMRNKRREDRWEMVFCARVCVRACVWWREPSCSTSGLRVLLRILAVFAASLELLVDFLLGQLRPPGRTRTRTRTGALSHTGGGRSCRDLPLKVVCRGSRSLRGRLWGIAAP